MPQVSPFFKQCFVTATVCCYSIGLGCAVGSPITLIAELRTETFLSIAWIVSSFTLAATVGTFFTPSLMNQLGRKITLYIVGFILIAGWIVIIISTNVEGLILARIVLGLGAGIFLTLDSILIGEYTSPRNRGAFITTISLAETVGIFAIYLLSTWLSWKILVLISILFPFTGLFMTIYIPESPSWLLTKGKHDECRKVFNWLRGENENKELEDMIKSRIAFERAEMQNLNSSYLWHIIEIIRKKEFYKPIIIVFHCNMLMHFAGIMIYYYDRYIIDNLMSPDADVGFWMLVLGAQKIISNFIGIFIINNVNRRAMVVLSTGLCISSHLALAIYSFIKYYRWINGCIWFPALLFNIHTFTLSIGIIPLTNVISGEVFPLEYRSVARAISLIPGNCIIFVISNIFPLLTENLKFHGNYILFAAVMALNLFIVWILLPETKGKTLQQIEEEFRGRPLMLEEIENRQYLELNPVEPMIPLEQKKNDAEAV